MKTPTNRKTALSAKIIARRIADKLFTAGNGRTAERLVLELKDGGTKYGYGWCRKAVEDQIELILRKE